ncbi:phospholipase D family protein [Hydrogenobacter hydrogenophilus]|uniref:phospholipase D family nuclease n=1 Tax=Hydrogenobacter hydrogenophilus TaxID=35835 RepID=UPI001FECC9C9|nr:phospholipase D family protein [Hydrogenobacter hydrogenophilus]
MRKWGVLLILFFLFLSSCKKEEKPITFESIEVYFSPKGSAQSAIIRELQKAQKSLDIAMFAFTSRELGSAVLDAYKRGVKVRIIMDQGQAREKFSRYPIFVQAGIPVKLLPVEGKKFIKGLMHNKFAVIDRKTVITGSYNWTASAEEINYENLLIIHSQGLAEKYEDYFESMWKKAGDGI